MATLQECYDWDFGSTLKVGADYGVTVGSTQIEQRVRGTVHYDALANVKFASFYVPRLEYDSTLLFNLCVRFIGELNAMFRMDQGVANVTMPDARLFTDAIFSVTNDRPFIAKMAFPGEELVPLQSLPFSGRVFFYLNDSLSKDDLHRLKHLNCQPALSIQLRSAEYAKARSRHDRPKAFICHDFEDKELIARPLAQQLTKWQCPVWYDEYSLKIGSSLRESIEKGIKECKKCVVVLSPAFLSNKGWTKAEFNSVFTREIIETTSLVLPIWDRISAKDVYAYSPYLADRVGIQWETGVENVARAVIQAIE